MILDEPTATPNQPMPNWGRATLDGILRKNAREHPDRLALVDDPDRQHWNAAPAQELTYAEIDRRVDALASFFRMAGLEPDSLIAIDAPPTADTVIILLAAFRAGVIVFPVPSLWTRRDCMAILGPLAPRGVIVTSVSKGESRGERLRDVADAIRSARLVFGYGGGLPSGVLDLAGSLRPDDMLPPPTLERTGQPGAHVATVTANGGAPANPQLHARSHRHWLASGLTLVLEMRLGDAPRILMPFSFSGLTGIGAGLVPWLLTAGLLHLHRFDRLSRLVAHSNEISPTLVVTPGSVAAPFAAALRASAAAPPLLCAVWKDKHPIGDRIDAEFPAADITAIDELAYVVRRRHRSAVAPVPVGPVYVPSELQSGQPMLEIRVDGQLRKARDPHALGGLVSMRGMAIPAARQIPVPGAAPVSTRLDIGPDGFVRTAVECQLVDGPVRGLTPIGRREDGRTDPLRPLDIAAPGHRATG
jgi:mycobactin salicyl-AMP ligase